MVKIPKIELEAYQPKHLCDWESEMPLSQEEEIFLKAIKLKIKKYQEISVPKSENSITLNYMKALVAGFEKDLSTKDDIKTKLCLYLQKLKAYKPSNFDGGKPIKNKSDVRPAVFWRQLTYINNQYFITASGKGLSRDNNVKDQLANGGFCFVVLVSKPNRVLVTLRADGGHTTISHGADVYYAGEIYFDKGTLLSWNNESGHYHPAIDLNSQIFRLLPEDKFVPRAY